MSRESLEALRSGTKSINAALLELLRGDLLTGVISPGVKLKIPALSTRYGVTVGAVREALSRLVSEGLVDFEDQRGFRSAEATEAGLRDTTRVRLLIEREALADAIRHGDDTWEANILAAQHRLARSTRPEGKISSPEGLEWMRRHKEFHFALVAACTSPSLLRLHNMFYDQTERYRFLSSTLDAPPRGEKRNVAGEHGEIVEAVLDRDERRALQLMGGHIQATVERALRSGMRFGPQDSPASGFQRV